MTELIDIQVNEASTNEETKLEPYDNTIEDNVQNEAGNRNKRKTLINRLLPSAVCPQQSLPLYLFTAAILLLLLWGVLYTLFKDLVAPRGPLFQMLFLFILAYLAGQFTSLCRLPPLLGMLVTGIVLRNVGFFHMTGIFVDLVSTLRNTAMVVILIKAGLGLDAGALRRLSLIVVRLAFIPCLAEAATVCLISHFLLGYSWLWGLLLGFILGAVSPAVVVPSLLTLKEKGYGEDKGISTLVVAASSIDDIAAISGFGIVLSVIFSQGEVLQQILQGPIEVAIGLSFGMFWGVLSSYIPHKNELWLVTGRVFMLGAGSLFAVFGSQMVGYSGAGPLASIVAAFVACCGWKLEGWTSSFNPVEDTFSTFWKVFQPILFGLIGTEIDFNRLDSQTIVLGLGVLSVGLTVRVLVCFLVTLGGTLNIKEKFFVAIAWFPKATVQAALGPVALDIARKQSMSDEIQTLASQVLTISVLSILVTAPLGALAISLTGPRLLNKGASPSALIE